MDENLPTPAKGYEMGMGASLAEELYSESLKISKKDLGSSLTSISKESDSHDCDVEDLQPEGGSIWKNSWEELDESSELDREWQRRREQYHIVISMGIVKVSLQENKLLHKKGLILALRNQSLSGTTGALLEVLPVDALRLLNYDLMAKKALEGSENAEASSRLPSLQEQSSGSSRLENYLGELQSLL